MATIRPIERDDLPTVAGLVRANLEGWSRDADGLARVLFDHPWERSLPPALVAIDDSGKLIGSVGAQSRRVRFGDAELAGVSVSYLVVASDRRAGAAGVMLIRELLGGGRGSSLDRFLYSGGATDLARLGRPLGPRPDLRLDARAASWALASDTRLNEAVPAKDLRPPSRPGRCAAARLVEASGRREAIGGRGRRGRLP